MEASWETGSPRGTQDPQCSNRWQWCEEKWDTDDLSTSPCRWSWLQSKGRWLDSGVTSAQPLNPGPERRQHQSQKVHWHLASFDVARREEHDITLPWPCSQCRTVFHLWKDCLTSPRGLRSVCRQEETGTNKTTKGTVGESGVGSRDRKWWRIE